MPSSQPTLPESLIRKSAVAVALITLSVIKPGAVAVAVVLWQKNTVLPA